MKSVFSFISCLILCFMTGQNLLSQVGVNSTGALPDPRAMLDISATDRGFLPPRMSTEQRDAIASPIPDGLVVFNTTSGCLEYYKTGQWYSLCGTCPSPPSPNEGSHIAGPLDIDWHWSASNGASGYKVNSTDSYGTATDIGQVTNYSQSGLSCGGNGYSLYIWAYNSCGVSASTQMMSATTACQPCLNVSQPPKNGGGTYSIVGIGTQCWFAENLRENNGVGNSSCPNGDCPGNEATYGLLYDWPAAMNGSTSEGAQGLCPAGWHVPADAEWTTLTNYISGGNSTGGNQLRSCRQVSSPLGGACSTSIHPRWDSHGNYGTDDYGLGIQPAGSRIWNGSHEYFGNGATLWTSTTMPDDSSRAKMVRWYLQQAGLDRNDSGKTTNGFAVRCLKD